MLRFIGRLVLLVIAAIAIFIGWAFLQDRRASAFVAESTQAICERWDFDELKRRSSAQLREDAAFMRQGHAVLNAMRDSLGPLKQADTPVGLAGFQLHIGDGKFSGTAGSYRMHARFERGEADLVVSVVREHGLWRILGFRVNSPAFDGVPLLNGKSSETI